MLPNLLLTAKHTDRALIPIWKKGAAVILLILAILLVYRNSFDGVFVFDDVPAILDNPTLKPPVHLRNVLLAPGDEAGTVGGRPLVNLTLALNYGAGGSRVEGYHAVNVFIHVVSTLLLFGIAVRTLLFARTWKNSAQGKRSELNREGTATEALWTAFVIALLWAVHPLQTESVTYIVQRAESLMGLFYLLTLYGFIRLAEVEAEPIEKNRGSRRWTSTTRKSIWMGVSVSACFLGMASKEVMATAPLTILLYDRAFVSGGWGEAWKKHGKLYICLAATWPLLGVLVASTHGRGGSVGFGSAPVWFYFLTQTRAITHYLWLTIWPAHLVFDYGTELVRQMGDAFGPGLFLMLLAAGSLFAFRKFPRLAFLGIIFFLLLAPSSSIVPIATEPQAEHRMYLPLAAVISLLVLAVEWTVRKWVARYSHFVLGGLSVAAAVSLGAATVQRNRDYRSEIALWGSTVQNAPKNPRAHNDLAQAWLGAKNFNQAFKEFGAAIDLDPNYAPAQYNLGAMFLDANRPEEAIPHLEKALSAPLHQTETRLYIGEAYERVGRSSDAAEAFRAALKLDPKNIEAAFGLGNNLAREGKLSEAVEAFHLAVRNAPNQIQIRNNLANALLFSGRVKEAIAEYREALSRDPTSAEIRENLERAEVQLKAQEAMP